MGTQALSRTRSSSPTSSWRSWTSSTGSGSWSARRSPRRAPRPRAADDRDAHPAGVGPGHPRRPRRVRPATRAGRASLGPHGDRSARTGSTRRTRGATRASAVDVRESAGRRAFVVVPPDPTDDEERRAAGTDAAPRRMLACRPGAEARRLSATRWAPLRVGLVHGRMKAAERDDRDGGFRDGELDVLVGTTVVEVGVDVPEATMMVVSSADRFGLAQLHQLRGRVGRGRRPVVLRAGRRDAPDDSVSHDRGCRAVQRDDRRVRARRAGHGAAQARGSCWGFARAGCRLCGSRSFATRAPGAGGRGAGGGRLLVDDGGSRPGHAALEPELTRGWLRRIGGRRGARRGRARCLRPGGSSAVLRAASGCSRRGTARGRWATE